MIRLGLGLATLATACGTPSAQHPSSVSAPLSLAADAQMLAVEMLSARGTRDAEALGVRPRRVADVLW